MGSGGTPFDFPNRLRRTPREITRNVATIVLCASKIRIRSLLGACDFYYSFSDPVPCRQHSYHIILACLLRRKADIIFHGVHHNLLKQSCYNHTSTFLNIKCRDKQVEKTRWQWQCHSKLRIAKISITQVL